MNRRRLPIIKRIEELKREKRHEYF